MTGRPRVMTVVTNADRSGAPIHALQVMAALGESFDYRAVFGERGPLVGDVEALGIPVSVVPGMRSAVSPLRDAAALAGLLALVRRHRPALLHCHSSKAGMLGRLVSGLTGVPVLFTVHGWCWYAARDPAARRAMQALERGLLRASRRQRMIFVADAVRRDGEAALGPLPGRTVWNGVPDRAPVPARVRPRTRFLTAARFAPQKDFATLLRAFEAAAGDTELVVAGEGTDTAAFAEMVARLAPRRGHAVRALGHRRDVAELMEAADAFVLASRWEALPLSIIEAMRAARPVIASAVGGAAELVEPGATGLLVPPGDPAALARALDRLRDPVTRAAMGAAGRLRYDDRFTLAAMAARTGECCRAAIALGRGTGQEAGRWPARSPQG